MTRMTTAVVALGAILLACSRPAHVATAAPTQCEQLAALKLGHTTIASAERLTGGTFRPVGAPDSLTNLPSFCRVTGELRPTPDSRIAFEVWMPLDHWNGKFAAVGNGGWAGLISYSALADELRRGYATVSTNTGHEAEPGLDMAKFAFGHPERLADFGWRSVHETTVAGKAISQAFYGRPARYAYFLGCSTGGKQGLMAAQRFPMDYDGIAVIAPANNWTKLMAGTFAVTHAAATDSAGRLPQAARRILHEGALRACDATDGVTDSLITNPARCTFDPATVQCPAGAGSSGTCLTAAQVRTARAIYDGLRDPAGQKVWPGLPPGSEPFWGALTNVANPFPIPISHFRWVAFGDPSWDWKAFDLTKPDHYARHLESERTYAPVLSAVDPDLRAFRARGGKLIQSHGWNDQLISAQNSIDYYESVLALERGGRDRASALRSVQDFYRLFMAPAMLHCGGGPGPNTYDSHTALEMWVERGIAPDSMIATQRAAGAVVRTRPLCPYPKIAKYNGSGDANRAESFTCGEP